MSSDPSGRSPLEYLFVGVIDFICFLEAADSLNAKRYGSATYWGIAGSVVFMIGYFWPKIKQHWPPGKRPKRDREKPSPPSQPESGPGETAKAKTGPPISLKQLFEVDWPNLPAFYHECLLSSQVFESNPVKVAWRVNGDFVGRSKFLAILIDPATKAGDAFKACEGIVDQYEHFIDSPNSEVDIEGQAPDDTATTHLKDMVFSKRIFIYYGEFSLAQKGLLETIYQNKELSVQFRDAAYEWAHRDDKPRDKPLVPNTTILPDAKLVPGLRIKVTKLSPGVEVEKAVTKVANIHEGKVSATAVHVDSAEIVRKGLDEKNRYSGARLLEIANRLDTNRNVSLVRVKAHLRLKQERDHEIVACPAVWLNERNETVTIPAGEQREIIALMGGGDRWAVPRYITEQNGPPSLDSQSIWQQDEWHTLEVSILSANGDAKDGEALAKFEYYWRWKLQSDKPDVAFKRRIE